MMRTTTLLGLLFAALLFLPGGRGQAPGDEFEERRFEGVVVCDYSAPNPMGNRSCTNDLSNQGFIASFRAPGPLQRLEVDLSWTRSSTGGAASLWVGLKPEHAGATAYQWRGAPNGTIVVNPVPEQHQGKAWEVRVLDGSGTQDPTRINTSQPFVLTVRTWHSIAMSPSDEVGAGPPPASSPTLATPGAPVSAPGEKSGPPATQATTTGKWIIPSVGTRDAMWIAVSLAWMVCFLPRVRRRVAGAVCGALVGLFTRLAEDRILAHPSRREINELVRRQPGIGLESARACIGLSNGRFRFHAGVLIRFGLVQRSKRGRRVGLWPAGHVSSGWPEIPESHHKILAILADRPGLTSAQVAGLLSLRTKPMRRLLLTLWRARRLHRTAVGRDYRFFPLSDAHGDEIHVVVRTGPDSNHGVPRQDASA